MGLGPVCKLQSKLRFPDTAQPKNCELLAFLLDKELALGGFQSNPSPNKAAVPR